MAVYIGMNDVQRLPNRQSAATYASIPCSRGNILHDNGTGVYTLRGNTPNCFARYRVKGKANIALPPTGTVGPIAMAITIAGEVYEPSRFIVTPAAVEEYNGVVCPAVITVPRGCCTQIGFEPVPASDDPTVAPAPVVNAQNIFVEIERIA